MGRRGEQCGQIVPAETPPPQMEVAMQSRGGGGGWMVVDSDGRATVLEVNKHAIMQRVGIHARDLRILDPLLSYPSAILVRDAAIILNLEYIKAIITAEEVFLRNPSDENVIPMVEQLKRLLVPLGNTTNVEEAGERKEMVGDDDEDESAFELQVLEVTLEAVCSYLAASTTELENAAYPALDELTYKVTSRNLDRVRKIKSGMTRLYTRVQKVRDELEQLLDDDEDMAKLYLSRKFFAAPSPSSKSGTKNWFPNSPTIGSRISRASRMSVVDVHGEENDVEEVEMLLEAYFSQIDGTLNKLATLREYIDDTEDYINIQIDSRRNQLIQLELFLNAAMLAVSFYSLITAIFGANIPYTWNDGYGYMFHWVLVVAGVVSIFVFAIIVSYARYKGLLGS